MHIVAPAGDIDKFYAAVDAGANEIYMGLQGFGARKNAKNFTLSEYKLAIDYAHERGCRVLLTLNTIMMDNEFKPLFMNLNTLYEAGLDAIIVQDLGMFKYLKDNFPKIEIHGSTQMTVSNHIEAEYLRELGFKRVVLSRELSLKEIKEIREKTTIELEIFVSGALCVCYSGKCYMSSFIGGRSGNRGMCAQPCRKIYSSSKGEKGYFISPKDQLMGKQEIDFLKSIGIESVKLEGRMKDEKYVYELTDYFKTLISGEEREERVSKIFNRGYGKGYFYENKNIINKNFSYNLGEKIGVVSGKEVLLSESLKFGDGITYVSKNYERLGGTNISKINLKNDEKRFRSSDADKKREAKAGDTLVMVDIPHGTRYIYKTFSKEIDDLLTKERHESNRKVDIDGEFYCEISKFPILKLKYINNNGEKIEVEVIGGKESESASKKGVSESDIYEKISELGETPFKLLRDRFKCEIGENLFIPVSIIKNMKRDGAQELSKKIIESYKRKNTDIPQLLEIEIDKPKDSLEIKVIVSSELQEKIVREFGIKNIYHKALQIVPEKEISSCKRSEGIAYNIFDMVKLKGKIMAHWGLNISNSYSLSVLESLPKIESAIISPELSFEKIKKLKKSSVKKALLIYGKLKVMHIGTDIFNENEKLYNDMGDSYSVVVTDKKVSEIYIEKPLDVIDKIEEIKTLCIDEVVLEFIDETPDEIKEIIGRVINKKSNSENTLGYNYWKGVF